MKKIGLYRVCALVLSLVLVLGALPLAAMGEASFSELVAGISKTACYADRMARAEDALDLYEAMTDEERAALADDMAILQDEISDLEEVRRNAMRFIMLVDGIGELTDLNEKEESLALAKSEGIYFGDTSYPGIGDALEALRAYDERITAAVDACTKFMDAVNELAVADIENYDEIKPLLTEAERYISSLDLTYDGVRDAQSAYGQVKSTVRARELFTEEFLGMVSNHDETGSYKDCESSLAMLKVYLKNDKFLPTYAGVDEALAKMERTEEHMKELIKQANVFINEVSAIGSAENYAEALLAACKTMSVTDTTAPGAATAKQMLDAAIKEYNSTVEQIMKDFAIL